MSAPLLYNYDLDEDCYRVRLVAGCLGVTLATHSIDMYPGREHLGADMLALNPQGRLPVLVDGDLVLAQPLAIMLHLAESLAPGHTLLPRDPATRARMMDWLTFATRDLGVAAAARATSMLNAPGDLAALTSQARKALRLLDDHLTLQAIHGQDFTAGPEPTLADLMLFPAFALSRDFGIDHDEFPALRVWARRVRKLPGFQTMPGIPDYH
ncbi:MAG: glutathione S-transferase family protein [Pararhodobacter sp.]